MIKSPIHFSKEEQLASQTTATTVSAIKENTQKVTEAVSKIPKPDNSDVIKKLEEVKSASLITNQELKKIAKKAPPETQKVQILGAELITIKGDKGEKGDKGAKGDKGDRGEKGEQGIQGVAGIQGKDGKDGKDGISVTGPAGRDGIDGLNGQNGKDGNIETADSVIEKLNQSKKMVDAERVRGLVGVIKAVENMGTNPQGAAVGGGKTVRFLQNGVEISAHVTEINFGTNLTATYAGNGRINVVATGGSGSGWTIETPGGTVNASNNSFSVSAEPKCVVADNMTYFAGAGYTYAGLTVTMDIPPSQSIRAFI